jgi:uncharacterized OB-fold protein
MMAERRVKPIPDRDTERYWHGLAEGRMELQHCRDCGHWTWPARPICSGCHGDNMAWEAVKGTGEVYSWIVVHRSTIPDMMPYLPYTLALVRLDEQADIYIPGRLVTDTQVHRGQRVQVVPEKITEEVGDLTWAAVD